MSFLSGSTLEVREESWSDIISRSVTFASLNSALAKYINALICSMDGPDRGKNRYRWTVFFPMWLSVWCRNDTLPFFPRIFRHDKSAAHFLCPTSCNLLTSDYHKNWMQLASQQEGTRNREIDPRFVSLGRCCSCQQHGSIAYFGLAYLGLNSSFDFTIFSQKSRIDSQ